MSRPGIEPNTLHTPSGRSTTEPSLKFKTVYTTNRSLQLLILIKGKSYFIFKYYKACRIDKLSRFTLKYGWYGKYAQIRSTGYKLFDLNYDKMHSLAKLPKLHTMENTQPSNSAHRAKNMWHWHLLLTFILRWPWISSHGWIDRI